MANTQRDQGVAHGSGKAHGDASREMLLGIIGSATDAIVTVDDQQNITLFNSAAERMFQCPVAEAIGRPLSRFIPERFREIHGEHVRVFGETGVTTRAMASQRPLMACGRTAKSSRSRRRYPRLSLAGSASLPQSSATSATESGRKRRCATVRGAIARSSNMRRTAL